MMVNAVHAARDIVPESIQLANIQATPIKFGHPAKLAYSLRGPILIAQPKTGISGSEITAQVSSIEANGRDAPIVDRETGTEQLAEDVH